MTFNQLIRENNHLSWFYFVQKHRTNFLKRSPQSKLFILKCKRINFKIAK